MPRRKIAGTIAEGDRIIIGSTEYTLGPDIDLEREDVRDELGNRVTPEYIERAVEDVHRALEAQGRRAPGRPRHDAAAPMRNTAVRLPEALRAAVEARAAIEGKVPAEIIREAVAAYVGPVVSSATENTLNTGPIRVLRKTARRAPAKPQVR